MRQTQRGLASARILTGSLASCHLVSYLGESLPQMGGAAFANGL